MPTSAPTPGDSPDTPDWIREGTKVIAWSDGGSHIPPHYALGVITKVSAKTFTIETGGPGGAEPRFPIAAPARLGADPLERSVTVGGRGVAYPPVRHVAPLDSTIGREIHARARTRVAEARARAAVIGWQGAPLDMRSIDDTINRLTQLRDVLAAPAERTPLHRIGTQLFDVAADLDHEVGSIVIAGTQGDRLDALSNRVRALAGLLREHPGATP